MLSQILCSKTKELTLIAIKEHKDWARPDAAIDFDCDSCDGDCSERALFGVTLFHPENRRELYLLYLQQFSPVPTLGIWQWDNKDNDNHVCAN